MKLKRNISKILTLSILVNNIYLSSNAGTLSRYETLEGEVIALDNIEKDDITEIEIFGNTVQDPNNLEDIQSVGDLYVNEEGEPVLDELGRKQYKIELQSSNSVEISWDKNKIKNNHVLNFDGVDVPYEGYFITDYLEVKQKTKYAINTHGANYTRFSFYDKNKNFISTIDVRDITSKTTPTNTAYMRVGVKSDLLDVLIIQAYVDAFDNNLIPPKLSRIDILLPCQLMKIGNTADRLYWNNSKGKYIVEKKVEVYKPDNQNINSLSYFGAESSGFQAVYTSLPKLLRDKIGGSWHSTTNSFSNLFKATNQLDLVVGKRESIALGPEFLYIKYDVTKHTTIEEFKAFLIENGLSMLFITSKPEIIETNITEKIIFSIYPGKTYISSISENGVNPNLKIYIDRIEQVSQEAVEDAVNNTTSSNISLARMFVNMLPDSIYKDQLQAKLNKLFSADIVLEKQSATANLDVYIKSENILMMSLDTNTVTFEDYSGVEELELQDAINISINSSLPYQLNAYIVGDITNKDKDKTLDLDILNIRDGSETDYKKFNSINNKIVLKDNCSKGNNINHNIDLKLSGDSAHDADIYKTTIKFEAEQK